MPALGLFKATSSPAAGHGTAMAAGSDVQAQALTPPSSGGKYRPSRLWRKGSEARSSVPSESPVTASSTASGGGTGFFAEQQRRAMAAWAHEAEPDGEGEGEAETVVILGPASERRSFKIAEDRDALLDEDDDDRDEELDMDPVSPTSPGFDPLAILRPVTPPRTGYATALSPPRRPLTTRSPPSATRPLPRPPPLPPLPLSPALSTHASPRPRASSFSRPSSSRASSPNYSSDEPARRREETAAWLARKPSGRFRRGSASTATVRRLEPAPMLAQASGSSADSGADRHTRGYEVEVTCDDQRDDGGGGGGEMRWSVVVRPGAVGVPSTGPVHVSTTGGVALAPPSASSLNLSLALDQPTGKLVFIAFPMQLDATPTRPRVAAPPDRAETPPPPPSPRSPRSPRTPAYKRQAGVWSPSPARGDGDLFTPGAARPGCLRADLLAGMEGIRLEDAS
ncbi:hypothetical protein Q5752_002684 [Cryptotrichosporon argae]